MKKQELRIGNIVSFMNNETLVVTGIFEKGIHDENYNGYGFDEIKAIAINEQRLLGLGFIKEDENTFMLHCNNIYFRINCNIISKEFVCRLVTNYSFLFKGMHHLQNIYFDLTGHELTVA